jgi:hypothetical protein
MTQRQERDFAKHVAPVRDPVLVAVDVATEALARAIRSGDENVIGEAQRKLEAVRDSALRAETRRADRARAEQLAKQQEKDEQRAAIDAQAARINASMSKVAPEVRFADPVAKKELVIRFDAGADGVSVLFAIELCKRAAAAIAHAHADRRMASLQHGKVQRPTAWCTPAFLDTDNGARPALLRGMATVVDLKPAKRGQKG